LAEPDQSDPDSVIPDAASTEVSGGVAEWGLLVDVAQVVTAVSAVIAVIVATWLGLKAIRVARADNGQAQQEFLYNQVDSVLETALALTSAASDLETDSKSDPVEGRRTLRRSAEAFRSRVRVLKALRLIPVEGDTTDRLQQFADVIPRIGLARQRLIREGRDILRQTVLDETDDLTSRLLADLGKRMHATPAYTDDLGYEISAQDGLKFSEVSDGSARVTARLQRDIGRNDWEPTVNQSVRLLMPWIRTELGWWDIQRDETGKPLWLFENDNYSGRYGDQSNQEVVEPLRLEQVAEDWLDEWPGRFRNLDENGFWTLSPEALADELLEDVSAEFLDRLLVLVADLRAGIPEVVLK